MTAPSAISDLMSQPSHSISVTHQAHFHWCYLRTLVEKSLKYFKKIFLFLVQESVILVQTWANYFIFPLMLKFCQDFFETRTSFEQNETIIESSNG